MSSHSKTGAAKPALLLGAVTGLCISLVVALALLTREPVAESQRRAALAQINEILPADLYDNDPLADVIEVNAPQRLGGSTQKVYRAYLDGQPAALVLEVTTLEGYSGRIDLLVAVRASGEVLGVRVSRHQETPGLGDGIDLRNSPWITGFDGKSLSSPPRDKWRVERDGGSFDQFTAATITPRAVVKAVREALEYFEKNNNALFAPVAGAQENNN